MQTFQHNFIDFIIQENVLKFGDFTLKSGRKSPYFFNLGHLFNGLALIRLGQFYAQTLQYHQCQFDVLFGPAYKGIPLSVATSMQLYEQHQRDIPYSFNRKEAKTHGEGGMIVGAPLTQKRVWIIDDVITAGTAKREAIDFIQCHQGEIAGIIIALDRQEKADNSSFSSVQLLEQTFNIPVISIVSFEDIIHYLKPLDAYQDVLDAMLTYQKQYGI